MHANHTGVLMASLRTKVRLEHMAAPLVLAKLAAGIVWPNAQTCGGSLPNQAVDIRQYPGA